MGLLRTAARVSVATHVHGNIRRRQEQRWAAEDQAAAARVAAATPPPAPAPAPQDPPATWAQPPAAPAPAAAAPADAMSRQLEQLTQLGQLRAAGVLTDAEFEAKKALIMAS